MSVARQGPGGELIAQLRAPRQPERREQEHRKMELEKNQHGGRGGVDKLVLGGYGKTSLWRRTAG